MSFEQEWRSPRRLEVLERLSDQAAPTPHHHRFWILVGLGCVVVVLAAVSFMWTRRDREVGRPQETITHQGTGNISRIQQEDLDGASAVSDEADQDRDGLSDLFEYEHGLNPTRPDSDVDGLFDREEVEVYKTDALNADSDRDGMLDGQEVRTNQNPNGTGPLRVLPSR